MALKTLAQDVAKTVRQLQFASTTKSIGFPGKELKYRKRTHTPLLQLHYAHIEGGHT